MLLWTGFVICTALIVYSGVRLSKYGDIIAEETGLGRTWIGVVLMASVTSLPELITGISSVTFAAVPDIAVGDVLGSCVFNLALISLLDALYRSGPLSARAHHGHILSGGFGILLLAIVAASLFLSDVTLPIGWIGPYTLLIIPLYFVAMRLLYTYEKRQIAAYVKEVAAELKYEKISTREAVTKYCLNAAVVVAAAVFLPGIGEGVAETTGLGQTFVGNIMIALSTSLPEVVVSVTAIRMGTVDLAVGNLFGSNIFNILILAVDDLFFTHGPLLSSVAESHLMSALSAIAMTAIAVIGLTYRAEKNPLFLAWDSIGILLVYLLNLMVLYRLR